MIKALFTAGVVTLLLGMFAVIVWVGIFSLVLAIDAGVL